MKPHKTQWYLQRIRHEFLRLKWTKRRRVQTHSEPDHVMFLPDNGVALRFENDSNFPQEWAVFELIRPQLGEIPIPDYTDMPKSAKDFAG